MQADFAVPFVADGKTDAPAWVERADFSTN